MMTNILTDGQRERLAEWVGYELLLPDSSSSTCRNPYKEPIFEREDGFMYYSMWLQGDLTSPESYYQVHHILLPKVREAFSVHGVADFITRLHRRAGMPPFPGFHEMIGVISASNETICRALLDVMEETE